MVNVKDYTKKDRKIVTRRCPYCHQDMNIKKGLTTENVKRLFRKPTFEDFIILFIVFMTIISFLVYTYELKAYQRYIEENCPIGQQQTEDNSLYLPGQFYNETLLDGFEKQLNNTNHSTNDGAG
jgi:hypothetical protein